ncbi:MAG TPA: hypothetical protein VK988_21495 [Acidimicrobiales bacterium]|nr:hypothetical protein [Acidimicrobiales bacterium]
MSLHAQPTTRDSVRKYLLAGYEVTEAQVDQVLGSLAGEVEIRRGVNLRSYTGYVAEQIATSARWPENPTSIPTRMRRGTTMAGEA